MEDGKSADAVGAIRHFNTHGQPMRRSFRNGIGGPDCLTDVNSDY
jgi:hypothetical protein